MKRRAGQQLFREEVIIVSRAGTRLRHEWYPGTCIPGLSTKPNRRILLAITEDGEGILVRARETYLKGSDPEAPEDHGESSEGLQGKVGTHVDVKKSLWGKGKIGVRGLVSVR